MWTQDIHAIHESYVNIITEEDLYEFLLKNLNNINNPDAFLNDNIEISFPIKYDVFNPIVGDESFTKLCESMNIRINIIALSAGSITLMKDTEIYNRIINSNTLESKELLDFMFGCSISNTKHLTAWDIVGSRVRDTINLIKYYQKIDMEFIKSKLLKYRIKHMIIENIVIYEDILNGVTRNRKMRFLDNDTWNRTIECHNGGFNFGQDEIYKINRIICEVFNK